MKVLLMWASQFNNQISLFIHNYSHQTLLYHAWQRTKYPLPEIVGALFTFTGPRKHIYFFTVTVNRVVEKK